MLDRLTSLEVFAKVASTGSFSAAGGHGPVADHGHKARRGAGSAARHKTLPPHHTAALHYRTRPRLLEASARVLADLEEADSAVAADRFEPRGVLRLNAPVSFGARQIAPLLPEFACRYPHVTVELGLNDRLVDLAEEGWDLAIRIGSLADSSLIARRIAPCRTVLCAAPSYLAARGTPRSVTDLKDHNCLGYTLSQVNGAERWMFGARGDVVVPVRAICAPTMAMRCAPRPSPGRA